MSKTLEFMTLQQVSANPIFENHLDETNVFLNNVYLRKLQKPCECSHFVKKKKDLLICLNSDEEQEKLRILPGF